MFTETSTFYDDISCSRRDQVSLTQLYSGHCRRLAAHRNIIDSWMNAISDTMWCGPDTVEHWLEQQRHNTTLSPFNWLAALGLRTRHNADRMCGTARHWSVSITWLILILSLSPAVCIQQSAILTIAVTLQWSLIHR